MLCLPACQEECGEAQTNLIKVQFVNNLTQEADSVSLILVQGIGALGDSILYGPNTLSLIQLPVSLAQDTIRFLIRRRLGAVVIDDSLALSYRRRLAIIRPECGLSVDISDLQILPEGTTFEQFNITQDVLQNEDSPVNIQLFVDTDN
ncbi:MAG: hypothetical protein HC880_05530 [Bacteroidia bacterium]|nr:hypothetical protein [Bacteroidia bacterium]